MEVVIPKARSRRNCLIIFFLNKTCLMHPASARCVNYIKHQISRPETLHYVNCTKQVFEGEEEK